MPNLNASTAHPAVLETGPAEQAIALEPDREYCLTHLGLDAAGNTDSALVFGAVYGLVGTNLLPRDDKLIVRGLASITIGPGIGRLAFRSPGGAPLLQIIPGVHRHGAW